MPYNNLDLLRECKGLVILIDETPHTLRSLPLLLSLGFTQVTYPETWRSMNKSDRIVFNEKWVRSTTIKQMPDPFVIFSKQDWENRYSYNTINHMINRALEGKTKLIIVCDKERYQTFGTHRPLFEQEFVKNPPIYYEQIFYDYSKYDSDFTYLLGDCKNIFYQKCASLLHSNTGLKSNSLEQLHNNLIQDPYNPLWDYYSSILMTEDGIQIPVDTTESGLLPFIKYRVEMSDSDIKSFIFDLRGKAERFLDPRLRERKCIIESSLGDSKIHKILKLKGDFGLQ
jgi:hypothetical protein